MDDSRVVRVHRTGRRTNAVSGELVAGADDVLRHRSEAALKGFEHEVGVAGVERLGQFESHGFYYDPAL
jgi:hypothetical protein